MVSITPSVVFKSKVEERKLERMHLQDILQRIEMEFQEKHATDGLAVVFCDQMSSFDQEKDLRETYRGLCTGSDKFIQYSHIMDSICFMDSAHCCGIQLADFVAGALHGFLRGYEDSEKLYSLRIYAQIRKHVAKGLLGYGIFEVPKSPAGRAHLQEKFKANFKKSGISPDDDIPF